MRPSTISSKPLSTYHLPQETGRVAKAKNSSPNPLINIVILKMMLNAIYPSPGLKSIHIPTQINKIPTRSETHQFFMAPPIWS